MFLDDENKEHLLCSKDAALAKANALDSLYE
jgi:hypothetical protein